MQFAMTCDSARTREWWFGCLVAECFRYCHFPLSLTAYLVFQMKNSRVLSLTRTINTTRTPLRRYESLSCRAKRATSRNIRLLAYSSVAVEDTKRASGICTLKINSNHEVIDPHFWHMYQNFVIVPGMTCDYFLPSVKLGCLAVVASIANG